MAELQPTHPPVPETPPARPDDRRTAPRHHLSLLWNLVFRSLRKFGAQGRNVYTAVGIFLIAGALVAVAGTVGFAALAEVVREGYTLPFDTAVLRWLARNNSFPYHFLSLYK
jgi:hypothetical protein